MCIRDRYKDKVKYWMTFNEINNQADIGDGFMLYADSGIVVKPEEDVYKRQVRDHALSEFQVSNSSVYHSQVRLLLSS